MVLYLVGKFTKYPAFDVHGIFKESYKASDLCLAHNSKDDANWFVIPMPLDREFMACPTVERGAYFPMPPEQK